MSERVRIAIVGAGAVSDYHHVPGIRLDPRAELVAVCDPNQQLLEQRESDWGPVKMTTDHQQIAADPDIDAVIVATPNFTHLPITVDCLQGGKHVMCEKPLGLNFEESRRMYHTARDLGLRHMTAFTYRFAPSMRYLKHLVESGQLGVPRHFRSQRFLDWPAGQDGRRDVCGCRKMALIRGRLPAPDHRARAGGRTSFGGPRNGRGPAIYLI